MNDVKGDAALRSEVLRSCERVIESGRYILGPEVEQFELAWAQAIDARYAIGVGNGMDAIEICLRAFGVGPGDEVITTSMTAFATVLAVVRSGATVVLADIDTATASLDPESVERCITSRTKAVVAVHLYGRIGAVESLSSICRAYDLLLFEDCAQSHLASQDGNYAGSFGRAAAWSFYPTKNLGALGDGGAVTTSSTEMAERARAIRNYGQTTQYSHDAVGMNSRLDELQAAILRVRLQYLAAWTAKRIRIANIYDGLLRKSKVRPVPPPEDPKAHVYHLYVVTTDRRDELRAHLAGSEVQTLVHYPTPAHRQRAAREVRVDPEGLQNSEKHADSCLSIPCHPGMTDEHAEYVATSILRF